MTLVPCARAWLTATVLVVGFAAGVAPADAASVDARVTGTFTMRARVTTAVNVRGEHRGQVLLRRWLVTSQHCAGDVCRTLLVRRQRAAHRYARLALHRVGPGRYAGSGVFYAGLQCRGRVYRRGSRAPYRITLRVTRTTLIGGVRFASAVSATYLNRHRTDATPCPLGPSHDAARYTGAVVAGLPAAPVTAFVATVDAATGVAQFADTSSPGSSGSPIVARDWSFGDPGSGAADSSTDADPAHRFTAPGTYLVTLTDSDSEGLASTVTEAVTVPSG